MDLSNKKPGTVAHYEALVADALRRVVEGLDEALDLQALAAPACMAPLHFHRVFRGLVGETPLQLHRRLRLERAAWRLAHRPEESVLRIALDAGYDTHESFTRAFREAFCRAPIEHRALAHAAGGMHGPGICAAAQAISVPPANRLQAACGLHADGPIVTWPVDAGTVFIHRGALTMNVDIETCPARRVAALAHQGPYHTIGAAFARLGGIAGAAGLFSHPGAKMVAIYHDDPETVPAAQLRSAAGVIVPQGVGIPAPLHEVLLPAGRWARTLHRGSYQGLGDAWERFIGQWLPQSGHRMAAGDCFEVYVNEMANTPEEELQTLLHVPLQD
jgi:AraC family transcriptional regulator